MQINLHQETNHPVFSLQNQLLSQTKTKKKKYRNKREKKNNSNVKWYSMFNFRPV